MAAIQAKIGEAGPNFDADYCQKCSDSGHELIVGQGARICDCLSGQAIRAMRENKRRGLPVNVVPRRYEGLMIETMEPDSARHPKQATLIPMLQGDPRRSLIMFGADSFGTGKSAIGWALYQSALRAGRQAAGGRLGSFVSMMRELEVDKVEPVIRPGDLRLWDKGLLFLDEFDKANLSDFSARMIFEFVNVAYEEQQQIVVATNLSREECKDHWSVGGGKYGPAIYRRLFDREDVIAINLDISQKSSKDRADLYLVDQTEAA